MPDELSPREILPRSTDASRTIQHAAWAARFGWLIGAITGTVSGFVLTWLLEVRVLTGRVHDPTGVAARASSALVGGLCLAGALAGHALGTRAGAPRYRTLGIASGILLAVTVWTVLVIAR